MGFSFYYRSTRHVTSNEAANIERAAVKLTRGHTWLSCEPLILSASEEDGHLEGGSKPTFQPHPDDTAIRSQSELPPPSPLHTRTVNPQFLATRALSPR